MNQPQCIITGCALVCPNEGKWAWGDLHRLGTALVFRSVVCQRGKTAWSYELKDCDFNDKAVQVDSNAIFDRAGVVVFMEADAKLNLPATVHLLGANSPLRAQIRKALK